MKAVGHNKRSLEVFNEDVLEYHLWMDKFSSRFWNLDQIIRHHKCGIEKGVKIFGEKARKHLNLHLIDDFGKIPNNPLITLFWIIKKWK